MKNKIAVVLLITSFAFQSLCFAEVMTVTTGFGYLTDSNGHITDKYILPIGEHPLSEGYTQTEVADQSALDAVEIYVEPISPEQKFNTQKFLTDCQSTFDMTEQIQAMPYQRSFESMLDSNPPAHDFSMFKASVQGLIGAGILTESHYTKMRAACLVQDIDLENY